MGRTDSKETRAETQRPVDVLQYLGQGDDSEGDGEGTVSIGWEPSGSRLWGGGQGRGWAPGAQFRAVTLTPSDGVVLSPSPG